MISRILKLYFNIQTQKMIFVVFSFPSFMILVNLLRYHYTKYDFPDLRLRAFQR